jgi:putative pyruvate formate lyase activating enzyme
MNNLKRLCCINVLCSFVGQGFSLAKRRIKIANLKVCPKTLEKNLFIQQSHLKIKNNISRLKKMLSSCVLCPRKCKVNRLKGEKGFCGAGLDVKIASYNLHFGEEPPISGKNGSGTIFFSYCTLKCIFCQNYPISDFGNGQKMTIEELKDVMINLQNQGAHNINLVTPTQYSPQIAEAIFLAKQNGLNIPIVYNSSGYESVEVLKLLDGLIDIYMPDAKYSDNKFGLKYSKVKNYVEVNNRAVKYLFKKYGKLKLDKFGIAKKGLIVRHLMLPENFKNTKNVLDLLLSISQDIFISFMSQYHPAHKYKLCKELCKKVTNKEYEQGLNYLQKCGFSNGWIQEMPNE